MAAFRAALTLLVLIAPIPGQSDKPELNTAMMQSTFQVVGPMAKAKAKGKTNLSATGTVLILGTPLASDGDRFAYTLVTAAHVLDDIDGDFADLLLRTRTADGLYAQFAHKVKIRAAGKPLYAKHSTADVAAMYVSLPEKASFGLIPTTFLVDDETVAKIGIHPGDEAFCLGFPHSASLDGGFPILRTGRISSYPLIPAAKVKKIIFDLFVYPGNSGSPVFYHYDNRTIGGVTVVGKYFGILGLVSQKLDLKPPLPQVPIDLAAVVPAVFIRETLAQLPPPGK